MNQTSKIYIAGHTGMVGSAIVRRLTRKGYSNLVLRTHAELDLTDQKAVTDFFEKEKPEYVFLAAARVGGIMANNTYRAQFIYNNLMIQNNVIHQSHVHGVKKLLFLGSSCIYPKYSNQPMTENQLLTGLLEYTNEPYAIAKIAGIKMCEAYNDQYGCDYLSVMPTNLYGPNDNYDLSTSHVLPALIRKIYLARCLEKNDMDAIRTDLERQTANLEQRTTNVIRSLQFAVRHSQFLEEIHASLSSFGIRKNPHGAVTLTLWGTGSPRREFLHVDDLAEAVLFVMEKLHASDIRQVIQDKDDRPETMISHLNIGRGKDLTIKELAYMVKEIIGFQGEIHFDPSKPDGTPRKLMDVSKINSLGWHPSIDLKQGIRDVFEDYINQNEG